MPMTQALSTSKELLDQLIQATPLQRLGQVIERGYSAQ